jgi:hypothetical protein
MQRRKGTKKEGRSQNLESRMRKRILDLTMFEVHLLQKAPGCKAATLPTRVRYRFYSPVIGRQKKGRAMSGSGDCPPRGKSASRLEILNERNEAILSGGCSRHRIVRGFRNACWDRGKLNLRPTTRWRLRFCGRIILEASGRLLGCAKSTAFRDNRETTGCEQQPADGTLEYYPVKSLARSLRPHRPRTRASVQTPD